MRGRGKFTPSRNAAAYGFKARKRAMLRPRKFYVSWVMRTMNAETQGEAEWRIRYVTGPDERTLTGKILGDPRWGRSALFAHLQAHRPTLEQVFQLTGGLLL